MQRLSASVVMYGDPEEVRRCLASILEHTGRSGVAMYLVNNASPGDSFDELLKMGLPRGTIVLARKENKGYGAGHNAVMPLMRSDYHVVSNPDIEIHSDVLNKMADWMDNHPDVVMCCPRLYNPDGTEQHIAKRRPALLPLIARQLNLGFLKKYERHYLMLDEELTAPRDVEFCSGSFFMMRSEVFRQIGGFDEKYFMYVEDADITQKALRYGRAVFLPQFSVTHAWHRAAHKNPRQFLWQLRSMARYFTKWGFRLK